MPPSRRSLPALAAAALCLLLAGWLTACGGDDDQADPAEPTTTTDAAETTTTEPSATSEPEETTTTVQPTDEEAVLAAVEGYWQTLYLSSAPPDPEHPDLERYLTGHQLEVSRALIEERQSLGQAVRRPENGPGEHTSEVTDLEGQLAVVSTCGVDDLVLYDVRSGIVLDDRVVTYLWTLALVREGDQWRVQDSTIETQWEGASACTGAE